MAIKSPLEWAYHNYPELAKMGLPQEVAEWLTQNRILLHEVMQVLPPIGHPGRAKPALSVSAICRLFEFSQNRIKHDVPSWDETFLQLAYNISKRSPDAETQVGAVIVSKDHHIQSVGYNGWMPNIDDTLMPNIRPLKHGWVLHAELNAILNCEKRPVGSTIYCTHQPCLTICFFACVASKIAEVVYIKNSSTTNTCGNNTDWELAQFLTKGQISVRAVDFTPKD